MGSTEEVLVVIQAESGEEIALPLAALDEQHQEVVLESDGTAVTNGDVQKQPQTPNQEQEADQQPEQEEKQHERQQQQREQQEHLEEKQVESSSKAPAAPVVPRQKQKRKENLVCLPFDLKIEFQFGEESAHEESFRQKPRKEYRTKKKIAAMEAAKGHETQQQSEHNNTNKQQQPQRQQQQQQQQPNQQQESPKSQQAHSPRKRHLREAMRERKEPEKTTTTTTTSESEEISDSQTEQPKQPPQSQPLPERRTRLSNSFRVATGKMYKCHDCGYSTERINNISLHIKKTCPKLLAK